MDLNLGALKKLIDLVSQIVGKPFEPYFIKKTGEARRYELEQLNAGLNNTGLALTEGKYEDGKWTLSANRIPQEKEIILIEQRAEERQKHQLLLEQSNLEQITSYAAEELVNSDKVPEEDVGADWAMWFFDYAKKVTSDDMQKIWGKILAGEIQNPNTFSLRTLDVLKLLTQREAECFAHVANYVCRTGRKYFLFEPDISEISAEEIGLLQEAGIVVTGNMVTNLAPTSARDTWMFQYNNYAILLERPRMLLPEPLPVLSLTIAGQQLMTLIETTVDEAYIERIGNALRLNNVQRHVFVAPISSDGEVLVENKREIKYSDSSI